MPIAESKPPIVVGIKQTSKETKTVAEKSVPLYWPMGFKSDNDYQKYNSQGGQKNGERYFVRCFLDAWRLHQRDHAVKELSPGLAVILILI